MIKYTPAAERNFSLFQTPFGQALDANNRWVKMAAVVPHDETFVCQNQRHGMRCLPFSSLG